MADNVPITSGSGLIIAADDDGVALNQWVKIKYGGNGSFTEVTTATGLPVQILSLPSLAVGTVLSVSGLTSASVSISNLPIQVSGTTIAITSLPDLGLNSVVKITSLPAFAVGSIVSVSGLTSAIVSIGAGSIISISGLTSAVISISNLPLQISGTTIAITSLPALGFGGSISVSGLTSAIVSISNLSTILQLVSGTTISITSLPDLGLNSFVKVSSLPGVVIISATNAVPVNIVAGGAGDGSILDGANNAIKATVLSYSNASPLAVRLTDTSGNYVIAGSSSATTVSNLSTVPLTVSGTTIAITSLPALGFGGSVSVSGLTSAVVSISNLSTILQLVSGTTIAITSLPPVPIHSISGLTSASVSISNLSTILQLISGTTIAITSLPNLGVGSILSINNLTVNISISSSIGNFPVQIIPQKTFWRFTATGTAAGTVTIKALVNSQTAIYVTNIIVSNENTAGNFSFIESSTAKAITPVIERLYLAANGGAVMPFTTPVALNTNTGLFLLTRTVTNYSVFVSGFTALEEKSL